MRNQEQTTDCRMGRQLSRKSSFQQVISRAIALNSIAFDDPAFDDPAFDESLFYKVPEKLRAVRMPPLPALKAVAPWTADPKKELINPWRYWVLEAKGDNLEKEIRNDYPVEGTIDGSADRRVIRVTGDFGHGSSLSHSFFNNAKLDRGRYRFAFRVRGTPGQSVEFELADDWRGVSKEAKIPLTQEWQEHIVEFEIKTTFKDKTTLRFNLPQDVTGTFDLADTRLKIAQLEPVEPHLLPPTAK